MSQAWCLCALKTGKYHRFPARKLSFIHLANRSEAGLEALAKKCIDAAR